MDGLELRVATVRELLAQATEQRDTEHRRSIEDDVFWYAGNLADDLWKANPKKDQLVSGELWPKLKDRLALTEPGDEKIARQALDRALADPLNRSHLTTLYGQALVVAGTGASGEVAEYARRMSALQSALGQPVAQGQIDQLFALVKGETTNLIGLFVFAQTALSMTNKFKGERPGDVVRAANLLRLALNKGAATLGKACDSVIRSDWMYIGEIVSSPEAHAKFVEASDKEWLDKFSTGRLTAQGAVGHAMDLLKSSRKTGALKHLLKAEKLGGDERRTNSPTWPSSFEPPRTSSPSRWRSSSTATTWILVQELQSASDTVKERDEAAKAAKEEKEKRAEANKGRTTPKTAKELKEDAALDATIARAEGFPPIMGIDPREALAEQARDNVIKSLNAHTHPKRNDKLTPAEETWWKAYTEISGDNNLILPGEEGRAKAIEFGKELITVYAIGELTGGLGLLFEGGELAAAGQFTSR